MKKLDFTGVRLVAAGACYIDMETRLKAGDIIHSIEHKLDDEGNHLGFEFSVEGRDGIYFDSLLHWPLYAEGYKHLSEAIAFEDQIECQMRSLAEKHREWRKNQPIFGNSMLNLLNER